MYLKTGLNDQVGTCNHFQLKLWLKYSILAAHRYHVMHGVDVTVTHVNPDRLQGKAKLLP